MSKFFKVILTIFILLFFCINSVFATNTTKKTTNNTTNSTKNTITNTSNSQTKNTTANSSNTTQNTTASTSNTTQTTTVTSVSDVNDGERIFSNVLNILLIAVGIVIIFLAIAILIRLK